MTMLIIVAALFNAMGAAGMGHFVYHEKDQEARAGGLIFLTILVINLVAFASLVRP